MYDVVAILKIYLESADKSDSVKTAIGKIAKIQQITEQDIGFGIRVLNAHILLDDSQGGVDALEEKIKEIEGVSQVQVEEVSRI
ncbi:hypothetical protein HYT84_02910 [Candidatus Micrarchaeota archaeon]|nr:hypothetical protein [Candidatus Micrarchaeota archaeon]